MERNIGSSMEPGAIDQLTSEQIAGMERNHFMKQVAGPALTRLLAPIYREELTDYEKEPLMIPPSGEKSKDISMLSDFTSMTVLSRLATREAGGCQEYQQFEQIFQKAVRRPNVAFHFNNPKTVLTEGIRTGSTLPLYLATSIYQLEDVSDDWSSSNSWGHWRYFDRVDQAKFDCFIDILRRDSFDKILMSLTKGPNGFLGPSSTGLYRANVISFFNFQELDTDELLLTEDALEIEDGKVIGLSSLYHLSADARRRKLNSRTHKESSAGCPVRHQFEDDETNELQEPLIITAKNFVIKALEAVR